MSWPLLAFHTPTRSDPDASATNRPSLLKAYPMGPGERSVLGSLGCGRAIAKAVLRSPVVESVSFDGGTPAMQLSIGDHAIRPYVPAPGRLRSSLPVITSQIRALLPQTPARRCPSGLKATQLTMPAPW